MLDTSQYPPEYHWACARVLELWPDRPGGKLCLADATDSYFKWLVQGRPPIRLFSGG